MTTRSRPLIRLLCVGLFLSIPALVTAGPNAGGVLVVHNTGLAYSTDPPEWPPAPDVCLGLDNLVPVSPMDPGASSVPCYWKVYAAFPPESAPRLKSVSWGIGLTSVRGGGVQVIDAGLPDPVNDFEITQGGWPNADEASIGETFPSGTKLSHLTELYWFAGYAVLGNRGDLQRFSTRPHAFQASIFVDDAIPPNTDPVADWGSLGFGTPGETPRSWCQGACCVPTGSINVCTITMESACTGVWHRDWSACDPNPCPSPLSDARDFGPAGIQIVRVSPNPFAGCVSVRLDSPQATVVSAVITDISGRLVHSVCAYPDGATTVTLTWAGHDAAGREVPTGVYLIRVQSPIGQAAARILKLGASR